MTKGPERVRWQAARAPDRLPSRAAHPQSTQLDGFSQNPDQHHTTSPKSPSRPSGHQLPPRRSPLSSRLKPRLRSAPRKPGALNAPKPAPGRAQPALKAPGTQRPRNDGSAHAGSIGRWPCGPKRRGAAPAPCPLRERVSCQAAIAREKHRIRTGSTVSTESTSFSHRRKSHPIVKSNPRASGPSVNGVGRTLSAPARLLPPPELPSSPFVDVVVLTMRSFSVHPASLGSWTFGPRPVSWQIRTVRKEYSRLAHTLAPVERS